MIGTERTRGSTATPSAQVSRFMARYDADIIGVAIDARARLRRRMPGAHELVYDNYNALVIGFGPTERASDAVISLALYPRWVTLFFLFGATLPDPLGLLKGSGKQVRSIRLATASTVDTPGVRALIDAALAEADPPMPLRSRGRVIIKSVSAKQRTRRPKARR
ncbi:MAG TPA: hypothetical protein VL263_16505 [Vicinamibacterales bacterium]|nr:hypothetical protein [Vicinamibacterales bacterium]